VLIGRREFAAVAVLVTYLSGLSLPILCGQALSGRGNGSTGLMVGVVRDRKAFEEGGRELLFPSDSYRSERYIFLSDFEGRALMNINGRDTPLTLVGSYVHRMMSPARWSITVR
jgi:hypothetical protein